MSDKFHPVAPSPEVEAAVESVRDAILKAGADERVPLDFILYGTAQVLGHLIGTAAYPDMAETAIKGVERNVREGIAAARKQQRKRTPVVFL